MRWLSAAVMLTLYTSSSWAFSIDDVAKQAQSLAGKGYETPKSNLPSVFRDMKYADYQQIQFNHDKAKAMIIRNVAAQRLANWLPHWGWHRKK